MYLYRREHGESPTCVRGREHRESPRGREHGVASLLHIPYLHVCIIEMNMECPPPTLFVSYFE